VQEKRSSRSRAAGHLKSDSSAALTLGRPFQLRSCGFHAARAMKQKENFMARSTVFCNSSASMRARRPVLQQRLRPSRAFLPAHRENRATGRNTILASDSPGNALQAASTSSSTLCGPVSIVGTMTSVRCVRRNAGGKSDGAGSGCGRAQQGSPAHSPRRAPTDW